MALKHLLVLDSSVWEMRNKCVAIWTLPYREAGCNPMSTGILSDLFTEDKRGLVMSIFNWGIYGGYGIAFPVGRYVPLMNTWNLVSAGSTSPSASTVVTFQEIQKRWKTEHHPNYVLAIWFLPQSKHTASPLQKRPVNAVEKNNCCLF